MACLSAVPIYAASKAAVDALVRNFAAQLRDSKDERLQSVRFVGLNLLVFESEMASRFTGNNSDALAGFAQMANTSGKLGTGDDLVKAIELLEGDKDAYKSGASIVIDAGPLVYPLKEYFERFEKMTGKPSPLQSVGW